MRRQASVGNDGDHRRQLARLVGIVSGEHDAETARAQGPHLLEHQETIAEIEATGVDYASSSALTHSAPALDVGLDIEM